MYECMNVITMLHCAVTDFKKNERNANRMITRISFPAYFLLYNHINVAYAHNTQVPF